MYNGSLIEERGAEAQICEGLGGERKQTALGFVLWIHSGFIEGARGAFAATLFWSVLGVYHLSFLRLRTGGAVFSGPLHLRWARALLAIEPSSPPWEKRISKSAKPWEMPALLLWAKSELVRAMEEAEAPSEAGQPFVNPTSRERRAMLRAWGGVCRPTAAAVAGVPCTCLGACATAAAAACSWCGVRRPDWLGERLTKKLPADGRSRDPARGVSREGR